MGHIDEDDFADFMSKVDMIDDAVKGLKEGSLSVEDVDKKYSDLLDEAAINESKSSKKKQQDEDSKKAQLEKERRKELAKLPKSIDDAEKKLEIAKETKDVNKI